MPIARKSTRSGKPQRPTLFDVAREAGVGTTTVSRVINGGHYVDPETMGRVQAVIRRLGYKPSQAARALKGEKTHSIGFIVPTLLDPFFARLASVVQHATRRKNYVLIVLASEDEASQETFELSVFESYRIDGVLVVPPRHQDRRFLSTLGTLGIPTIAVDRILEGRYSSVICNNYEVSREAVEHLVQHGWKNILCFGGDPGLSTIQERIRGYLDAIKVANLTPNVASGVTGQAIIREQFQDPDRRPDAVFALYSDATVAAYEFLVDARFELGRDVALLGFDDFPLAGALRPSISVVRQPIDEIGQTAARLLFEQIETASRTQQQVSLCAELILRESCGCAAAASRVKP